MKSSHLLCVGYKPHCWHSGSQEGDCNVSVQTADCHLILFWQLVTYQLSVVLTLQITSDLTFSPRAGQGQWPGCTSVEGTVGISLLLAQIFNTLVFSTSATMLCTEGTNFYLFLRFCGVAGLPLTSFPPYGLKFSLYLC